jgi:hypothetical protein
MTAWSTASRAVRPDTLGAWLIKVNGDLGGTEWLTPGRSTQHRCVRPGYRCSLMAAGQPVVLWVSGRRLAPGVWGLGRVEGPAQPPDAGDAGDAGGSWSVPLALDLLPAAGRVARRTLRGDPRLSGLEVLRVPQGANPSYLTVDEFAALRDHLG